jgi:hypothetical protein
MITDKQLEANRRNATNDAQRRPYPHEAQPQRHTSGQGPRTEAGKNVSKLNALRHQIFGGQACPENDRIDAALTAAYVYAGEAKNPPVNRSFPPL